MPLGIPSAGGAKLLVRLDEVERAPPGVVGRLLELLLLAVEEAVRRAVELDQLVLLAGPAERLLELEVVLVRDALVGPALEGQDRRLELWHELDHPARSPVEPHGAREPVPRGGGRPRAAASEAEADSEDRAAAERAQVADAGAHVGLHLRLRQLLYERHVVPVVRPLVDTCGATEVVEGDGRVTPLGEAHRELLVEPVEAADVGQDHDAGGDFSLGQRPERGEAVAVLALEDEVVVRDSGARDARDRRLGVEVETHGAASLRKEARSLRRTECGGRRIAARGDERRDPRPARTGRGSAVDAAPGGRAARAAVTSTGAAGCRASAAETRPARAPPRALRPVTGIDTKVLRPARPWPQPSRIRALQSRAGVTKPCGTWYRP